MAWFSICSWDAEGDGTGTAADGISAVEFSAICDGVWELIPEVYEEVIVEESVL